MLIAPGATCHVCKETFKDGDRVADVARVKVVGGAGVFKEHLITQKDARVVHLACVKMLPGS